MSSEKTASERGQDYFYGDDARKSYKKALPYLFAAAEKAIRIAKICSVTVITRGSVLRRIWKRRVGGTPRQQKRITSKPFSAFA